MSYLVIRKKISDKVIKDMDEYTIESRLCAFDKALELVGQINYHVMRVKDRSSALGYVVLIRKESRIIFQRVIPLNIDMRKD